MLLEASETNFNTSANSNPDNLDRAMGTGDVGAFSSVSQSNSSGTGSYDPIETALQENIKKVEVAGEPNDSTSLKMTAASDDPLTGVSLKAVSDGAGNTMGTARDIGGLTDYKKYTDYVGNSDQNDYYKFSLSKDQTISVFFNGLASGTKMDLLDSAGKVIKSSTNEGTKWSSTNSGSTGGSISETLKAGTYYVNVTPATITGNSLYDRGDEYSLMFQPHDAAKTVAVAASNTANKGGADFFATGTSDQAVINKAIEQVGKSGGGTVLLLGGSFNISGNIFVTYDNVTIAGVGWNTTLKQANNTQFKYAGMLRSAFAETKDNVAKPRFDNQHFRHLNLDGNRKNQTTTKNAYGNFGCYEDSSFEDLRVHDFASYGLDPHENSWVGIPTVRLTVKNNLVDHNGQDGITIDNCEDSLITGNISDSNVRHGINICTASVNNTFSNNVTTNNGANGITVQPGTELDRTSDNNKIIGNVSKFNKKIGIYVYLAENTEITDNTVADNYQHGIRLRSSSSSLVQGNQLLNNSQELHNKYSEIYLDNNGSTYSTYNSVKNNNILNNKTKRSAYGIAERSASDDYNTYQGNTISGTVKPMKIIGLNSKVLA